MATTSRVAVARTLHLVFGEGLRVPDGWDSALASEDAGFAHALLGQCLRRWGTLQAYAASRLQDPGRGMPLGTQVTLAMGLAQLAWLPGVTDHAAVNESVTLATLREVGFPPHKGLVNAILRRASRDRGALRASLEAMDAALDRSPFADRVLKAALAHRGQTGLEALWKRLQAPPHPFFRALDDSPLPPGLEPFPDQPGALQLTREAAFPRQWLAQGSGMVQDLSSQALLAFRWDRPVTRILDACSAPGGKATALGRRFPGASLTAIERSAARAKRLEENLKVRKVTAEILVEDAAPWMRKGGPAFDLIMLDAPCSGSGTLQKHPELAWLGDGLDIPRLLRAQRELLEAALTRLAPGGLLIYAVCSWLPEEGRAHGEQVLSHPQVSPAPIWAEPQAGPAHFFHPDPLAWPGEGFQALAFTKD